MVTAAFADPAEQPQLLNLSTILQEWEIDAKISHDAFRGVQVRGPRIPFPHLVSALGGAWPPGLHVLHGQPGTGKTALGLQLVAEADCPALYLTAEVAPLELVRCVVARISGQYLGRFKSGELTPEQSLAYARAALTKVPTCLRRLAQADQSRSQYRIWFDQGSWAMRASAEEDQE